MVEMDGYRIEARPNESGTSWSLFIFEGDKRVYYVANYGDSEDEVEKSGVVQVCYWMAQVEVAQDNVLDLLDRMRKLGVEISGEDEAIKAMLPIRYFHPTMGVERVLKEGRKHGIQVEVSPSTFSVPKFTHWCGQVGFDYEGACTLIKNLGMGDKL